MYFFAQPQKGISAFPFCFSFHKSSFSYYVFTVNRVCPTSDSLEICAAYDWLQLFTLCNATFFKTLQMFAATPLFIEMGKILSCTNLPNPHSDELLWLYFTVLFCLFLPLLLDAPCIGFVRESRKIAKILLAQIFIPFFCFANKKEVFQCTCSNFLCFLFNVHFWCFFIFLK